MTLKARITQAHIDNGRAMRRVIQHDIGAYGKTFEGAVEDLAHSLGIQVESVKLAVAIANDADAGGEIISQTL